MHTLLLIIIGVALIVGGFVLIALHTPLTTVFGILAVIIGLCMVASGALPRWDEERGKNNGNN